jgi:hypothetical protein
MLLYLTIALTSAAYQALKLCEIQDVAVADVSMINIMGGAYYYGICSMLFCLAGVFLSVKLFVEVPSRALSYQPTNRKTNARSKSSPNTAINAPPASNEGGGVRP